MTTPNEITQLKDNQIFVFGSNLNGDHAGGAARLAKDSFGAEMGTGNFDKLLKVGDKYIPQ